MGLETKALLASHGTILIPAPITHLSSVGLVERAVQMVEGQLRKWVIQRGQAYMTQWVSGLTQALLNINTRLIKIHGYTPSEILLGYKPAWQHHTEGDPPLSTGDMDEIVQYTSGEHWSFLWEHRDEQREGMMATVVDAHQRTRPKNPMWTPPKAGDLVLVRRFQLDKDKGRKLEPKWEGPKLLQSITASGVTRYVRDVYGEGNLRKYQMDDAKTYLPRTYQPQSANTLTFERNAMVCAGHPQQRAIDLPSITPVLR